MSLLSNVSIVIPSKQVEGKRVGRKQRIKREGKNPLYSAEKDWLHSTASKNRKYMVKKCVQ